ncbi:hypothetical protein IWY39_000036 [Sphingobium sp. JAI105]|uniref:hypothetical protein n=1 Tax=Sphingobium sp. JAI105 TaxID=2787715 RepID=UPI0018CA69E4|nr:hypothetical protein [Sphingobium sp. JAI105]MBG6116232.1 hypothetical protein [Sphingobium sp. JAI105]
MPVTNQPPCDGCGTRYRTLFNAFMSGRGFVALCGACVEPARGLARAYTGPYPIRSPKTNAPDLRLIAGGAHR